MTTKSLMRREIEKIKLYQGLILEALNDASAQRPNTALYEPIKYLLNLGGKRLRPVLVVAACEALNGKPKQAIPAALAVEIFHNFTLMHDDIMDDAPLRRGKPTVHEKWNANTAILSGDAMLVGAYEELVRSEGNDLAALLRLFNTTALEVCEGQQLDMAFEEREDVSEQEYIEMIRLKTSVLLAAALQMGAMVAGADAEVQSRFYRYGIDVGLAFQLQDDYLDAFGNPEEFGKQVGGDILADKKTYLAIRCASKANSEQLARIRSLNEASAEAKVKGMQALYLETGAALDLQTKMDAYYHDALQTLDQLPLTAEGRDFFRYIAELVRVRTT